MFQADLEEYNPKFNELKTTEAAHILLNLSGGEINYMKLIKLLYFIDKKAMKEKEHPITYDIYFSMKDGQVLSTVLDLVNNKRIGNYWHKYIERSDRYTVRLINPVLKLKMLSPSEVKIIKAVYHELGHLNQFELGRLTKKGSEYKATTSRIRTPLDDILSDLGFNKGDILEIKETLKERADIENLVEV